MNKLLEGKNVVVTGTARGMGKQMIETFAENGANVFAHARSETEEHKTLCKELAEKNNVQVIPLYFDLRDADAVKEAVKIIRGTKFLIDGLVNNAGITRDGLLMRMSEADFDDVLNTNLKGAFHTIRFASRQMLKQRSGRIINLSSVVGVSGNAGQANYAASKAGVIGLTKAAAREMASRGITVNAIAPGFIETDMTDVLPEKVKEASVSQIPLGKFGKPEDVAGAAAFLASEAAGYITGQVLHVDGGMVM